jgi:hypothetical protein
VGAVVITVPEIVRHALVTLREVERELQPMTRVVAPTWRWFVHPHTLRAMEVAVFTDASWLSYNRGRSGVVQAVVLTPPPNGHLRLLDMVVMPDPLVSWGVLELRYTKSATLPHQDPPLPKAITDTEYTGDKRSHP